MWDKVFWEQMQAKAPILCVDGVVINEREEVLLSLRDVEPEKGKWHLPGGVVEHNEEVETAVKRVIRKEASLETSIVDLIGVYSDPNRDPRGHFVTVAYLLKESSGKLEGDFQSSQLEFFGSLPNEMGFDSRKIATEGLVLWNKFKK